VGHQRLVERLAAFVRQRGLARLSDRRRFPLAQVIHDVGEIVLAALVGRAVALDETPAQRDLVRAGPIGCEYACIMALLGCSVTLVDSTSNYLSFLDSEIATLLHESMRQTGIELIASSRVDRVSPGPPCTLTLDNGRELKADAIVVAAGRLGNTEDLLLGNAGLTADERGFLPVDETFQTSQPHIRAAGDVIGLPALASTSMEQARLAMVHAFDLKYKQQVPNMMPYGIHHTRMLHGRRNRRFGTTPWHLLCRWASALPQQRPRRHHW